VDDLGVGGAGRGRHRPSLGATSALHTALLFTLSPNSPFRIPVLSCPALTAQPIDPPVALHSLLLAPIGEPPWPGTTPVTIARICRLQARCRRTTSPRISLQPCPLRISRQLYTPDWTRFSLLRLHYAKSRLGSSSSHVLWANHSYEPCARHCPLEVAEAVKAALKGAPGVADGERTKDLFTITDTRCLKDNTIFRPSDNS
jgi:hypothetical protein